MIEAYKRYWKRYFDFKGCSSRSDFWWTVLCNIIIFAILLILLVITDSSSGMLSELMNVAVSLFALATIIPGLSLMTRRFHDANVSGWWLFSFIVYSVIVKICTYIGVFAEILTGFSGVSGLEATIAIIAVLIRIGCFLASIVIEVQPSSSKSRWRTNNRKEN